MQQARCFHQVASIQRPPQLRGNILLAHPVQPQQLPVERLIPHRQPHPIGNIHTRQMERASCGIAAGLWRGARVLKPALQNGVQSVRLEGFADEIVHPRRHAVVLVLLHGARRHRNDWQVGQPPDLAQGSCGCQSIENGHVYIHEHQVVGFTGYSLECLLPVVRNGHFATHRFEHLRRNLLIQVVILDQQNTSTERRGGKRCRRPGAKQLGNR